MEIGFNSLMNLAKIRKDIQRKRVSSYDKTGGNVDCVLIPPRVKYEICNIRSSGCVKHIWMTLSCQDPHYLRKMVIRMWWDDEATPSVECPIGDFFGVGHAKAVNFWSLPLSMGPQDGRDSIAGFRCHFLKVRELKWKTKPIKFILVIFISIMKNTRNLMLNTEGFMQYGGAKVPVKVKITKNIKRLSYLQKKILPMRTIMSF